LIERVAEIVEAIDVHDVLATGGISFALTRHSLGGRRRRKWLGGLAQGLDRGGVFFARDGSEQHEDDAEHQVQPERRQIARAMTREELACQEARAREQQPQRAPQP
jgi:hypothetical protein